MKAIIVNYRGGRHVQKQNQAVVTVEGVSSKEEAEKLVGKTVSYTCEGKNKNVIAGKVSAAHGNSGALRVLFEKGIPGQSLGKEVSLN